jgi:transcriptional regulator with XRE-family HTH domain
VQLRKEAGLNQTALAVRLGITQSEVSKYERGERGLDDARLRAWLSVLGMATEEAFEAALERAVEERAFEPEICG